MDQVEYVVALMALPPFVWLISARTRGVGWGIGLLLVLWLALTLIVVNHVSRAAGEWTVSYLPVAVAIVVAGRILENRIEPSVRGQGAWVFGIALTITVFLTGVVTPLSFYIVNSAPFRPSANEFMPPPAGLSAVQVGSSSDRYERDCGSAVCAVSIRVTGTSDEDVHDRVRRHLIGRGWALDDTNRACKQNGWLFDFRELCVRVATHDGAVTVTFDGARAWN